MQILLVQLSDLHANAAENAVEGKWDALCSAVVSDINSETKACVIAFCGDAAYGGKKDEFQACEKLIQDLLGKIGEHNRDLPVHVLVVPGNHDCDLTSEDQTARDAVRGTVSHQIPSTSVQRVLLESQSEYFDFSSRLPEVRVDWSLDSPFYQSWDLELQDKRIRFHLLNSSWTSMLKEKDDLRFPLDAFNPPKDHEADYSVTIAHHPYHWFLMPDVRRPLRDIIETHSELVLTGHEHENEASRREVPDNERMLDYIEGGVLQDHDDSNLCTFNTIRIDFSTSKQTVSKYRWEVDHFKTDDHPEPRELGKNLGREDRIYALSPEFERWLDDFEDPLNHPREPDLRLSHLYAYPDLRKYVHNEDFDQEKPEESVLRIRSEDVFDDVCSQKFTLITGDDKSGKTSLAKRLFSDLHRSGRVPVLVDGNQLPRNGSAERVRACFEKSIKKQYRTLTQPMFEQVAVDRRVIIIDDFHDGPIDPEACHRLVEYINSRSGLVIMIAGDDYYVESIRDAADYPDTLLQSQRYDICQFGKVRLENLARKWRQIGNPNADPSEVKIQALKLQDRVEGMLAAAGLPHSPWLLLVMLEQADAGDAVALKNGSYGHLYQAIITMALTKSNLTQPDISGKYTYLAELARHLYEYGRGILTDIEARAFHREHCDKFDLPFDYERVRNDLVAIRILRNDGGEISFRHKYVYCFFVGWWVAENIHTEDAKKTVRELCGTIHNSESSNTLVFLAHLTKNPVILEEMKLAAANLFSEASAATIDDDVKALNSLKGSDSGYVLPNNNPEVNRRLIQEAHDDSVAQRQQRIQDGRELTHPSDEDESEIGQAYQTVRDIRSALRTIGILGQVLRNGASSTQASDKLAVMQEIFGLGRRVLGHIYGHLDHVDELVKEIEGKFAKWQEEDPDACQEMGFDSDDARELAERVIYDIYWMASTAMVKRVSHAVGMSLLDTTSKRLVDEDGVVFNRLVDIAVRLNRRQLSIPSDDIVRLHKNCSKESNRIGCAIISVLALERMALYDTQVSDKQKVCKQIGIRVPTKSLDRSMRRYSSGNTNVKRLPTSSQTKA